MQKHTTPHACYTCFKACQELSNTVMWFSKQRTAPLRAYHEAKPCHETRKLLQRTERYSLDAGEGRVPPSANIAHSMSHRTRPLLATSRWVSTCCYESLWQIRCFCGRKHSSHSNRKRFGTFSAEQKHKEGHPCCMGKIALPCSAGADSVLCRWNLGSAYQTAKSVSREQLSASADARHFCHTDSVRTASFSSFGYCCNWRLRCVSRAGDFSLANRWTMAAMKMR